MAIDQIPGIAFYKIGIILLIKKVIKVNCNWFPGRKCVEQQNHEIFPTAF